MKHKHNVEGQSGFWVKLIGVLLAVGIVLVLVFSGIQNVMSQVSDLQRQLDTKMIEFDVVSGQLAEANRELGAVSSELDDLKSNTVPTEKALDTTQAMLIDEYRDELAATQFQLEDAARQLRDKTSELSDARAQITKLHGDLSERTKLLEATQRELSFKSSLCESESAFAELDGNSIEFDLLCQPLYPKTIAMKSYKTVRVKVNLARFRDTYGARLVRFRIHFAIDHGRLEIQELGSVALHKLSDSGGRNLRDIEISTDEDSFEFKITDVGFRSAKFDLSVWPR